jgi:hypothetical protein
LKEAKDICDGGGTHTVGVDFRFKPDTVGKDAFFKECIKNIRATGIEVPEIGKETMEELRHLATVAILRGENDIAIDIINVVKKFT